MTTQLQEIGLAVWEKRRGRGLSVKEMSKLAGVTETTWFRVERGLNVHGHSLVEVLDAVGLKLEVKHD